MAVPPKNESLALKYARLTLPLMIERNIEPTPVNYAVWYHYVAGDKKELNQEIDQILKKKKLAITNDVNMYLYNRYIIAEAKKENSAAEQTSQNTQSILAEIMGVIEKFSGDTAMYNQQLDTHVEALSSKILDPALQEMAKEIITRAAAIRTSSAELGTKLEDSKREVVNLKTNLERITNEANLDFLTGTANRKALETKLIELTDWAKERKGDLCLLMIDIDHFKKFNDTHGHLIGDEVLKKVGRTLLDSVKGKDFVARYGGEEFAVLLPSTPLSAALIVAENLRNSMSQTELVRRDTNKSIGSVTISIGVARYRPEGDSVAIFISRADDALYRSKTGGRNRVTQESFE
jgi:diguanylate cyclase